MNYNQAQERVNDLKKFYKSLLWFGIVAVIIFGDDILEKGIFNFSLWNYFNRKSRKTIPSGF